MELIRTFEHLTREDLPLAGGKGTNLGAMVQAGLPVPPGYVVLTHAYQRFVQQASIFAEIERLAAAADANSQESLDAASARIRALFDQHPVPTEIAEAIVEGYKALGGGPVAVRSSATAEDLPDASFAGQQETYLNVEGAEQVVESVRRCWSSLWTGRALSYRIRNGIAPGDVALAAVVQRLVDADVAGVLFTADPISGRRDHMVIDGAWGLGEAVVSGLVSPDNWLADGKTGAILREQVAAKTVMIARTKNGTEERPVPEEMQRKPVLDPAQVAALVDLGRRAAAHFGAPQDLEWAVAGGELYLLQSRPITTLFPLPEPAPPPGAGLRIYATLNGMQGFMEPITPAGISVLRTMFGNVPQFLGLKMALDTPAFFTAAAGRIYLDVTPLLRTKMGRERVGGDMIDKAMGQAVQDLLSRVGERLGPVSERSPIPVRRLSKRVLLTLAGRVLRTLVDPDGGRQRAKQAVEAHLDALEEESRRLQSIPDRVRFIHRALGSAVPEVVARTGPPAGAGMAALAIARKRLVAWGLDPALLDPVGRSVPHNPTTEMDLALWQLSRRLLAEGAAPSADHPAVAALLDQYGHRTVREIDIGLPRWREEPGYILHLLSTYMEQGAGTTDPEHHFQKGAVAAEEGIATVVTAVRSKKGPLAAALMRLLLRRHRQLIGLREWHKFYVIRLFATVRRLLKEAGADLVKESRLELVDDVFFLTLDDLVTQRNLREVAAQNRRAYERDMRRRPVPLAMTSEGEVSYGIPPGKDGVLAGAGASAGSHEGVVRVILNPVGARLELGEVLVAPGTDPAWTPLFLTAGALVTETGGMMSHGSVVAREYGIPAVVGVPEATTRLQTGQRVRVDGSAGTVVPLN
ncbi:MAG: PEP/pyruvate-binding domain-containing protein [Bacillota bacterium]